MKIKAKTHYWIDLAIGIAFLLAAISGIVLLFAPSGFQGGRNQFYGRTVLLLSTHAWGEIHTWSSLAMIGGVLVHFVGHWNWVTCMTKRVTRRKKREDSCPVLETVTE